MLASPPDPFPLFGMESGDETTSIEHFHKRLADTEDNSDDANAHLLPQVMLSVIDFDRFRLTT